MISSEDHGLLVILHLLCYKLVLHFIGRVRGKSVNVCDEKKKNFLAWPCFFFFKTFSKLYDSIVGSVFILCCRSVALRMPLTVPRPTVEPGATFLGNIINCKVGFWRRVCSPTRYWEMSMMECITVVSCVVAAYNAFLWQRLAVTLTFHYCTVFTALHLDLSHQAVVINKDPRMWN